MAKFQDAPSLEHFIQNKIKMVQFIPHLPWRAITESRTSDALSTEHDEHSQWMSDKNCMKTDTEQETEANSAPTCHGQEFSLNCFQLVKNWKFVIVICHD